MGVYWLLPPGSSPPEVPAIVQIRPVQSLELQALLQNLYGFDNPYVAQMNAMNLGLASVIGALPVRQINLPQGAAHVREFDAVTMRNYPARVMVFVIQGLQASVEVVVMMNLYRWMEFAGPCLEFVGRINLAGTGLVPYTSQLRAVVDEQRKDQIEYQLIGPDDKPIPLTAFPTNMGHVTINVGTLIQTGDINGTGIAIGTHSTAKVS